MKPINESVQHVMQEFGVHSEPQTLEESLADLIRPFDNTVWKKQGQDGSDYNRRKPKDDERLASIILNTLRDHGDMSTRKLWRQVRKTIPESSLRDFSAVTRQLKTLERIQFDGRKITYVKTEFD